MQSLQGKLNEDKTFILLQAINDRLLIQHADDEQLIKIINPRLSLYLSVLSIIEKKIC